MHTRSTHMKNILKVYYHKYNKNYQADFLNRKSLVYFKNCKNILDLGCGGGEFVLLDKKRITGIDSNRKSVLHAKKKGLKAVLGNVKKLPFKDSSYEGVHCSHVIEHLYPADAYLMLSEVARVLKKGGVFVLSTPILWKGFYNDFTHIKPYLPESIIRYLVNDGQDKTLSDIKGRFEKIDFYWRFRPLNFPGKFGYLLSNYLYQFGFHLWKKDAYTMILKKSE